MCKFITNLIRGKRILDTSFCAVYLKKVIDDRDYVQVLRLHKNDEAEKFTFRDWTFDLVAHDIPENVCRQSNIPYNTGILCRERGERLYRYYFLLAANKRDDRKYLIPVDSYAFAVIDCDLDTVFSEWFRENWLRKELNRWIACLCNTDADITEWRYLRRFFAWWCRLKCSAVMS